MKKQAGLILIVLAVGGLFLGWYFCNINNKCTVQPGGLSLTRLDEVINRPRININETVAETAKKEDSLLFRFATGSNSLGIIDKSTQREIEKIISEVKDLGMIVITGQREPAFGGKPVSDELAQIRVNRVVNLLERNGLARNKILVVAEGTLEALDLPAYQMENRKVVLIVDGSYSK